MSTLGDSLKDAYAGDEAHARSRVRDPHRTIGAIRRRRTVKAAGAGTVAALGVGAVGAIWMFAPGGQFAQPASPAPSATCNASIYIPPNPAARGDLPFAVRAYIDLRPDSPDPKVVAVLPDGSASEVEPTAEGDYVYSRDGKIYVLVMHGMGAAFYAQPMVLDYVDGGYAGAGNWDGHSLYADDYRWTTVVPAHVPQAVNTQALMMTLATAVLDGGVGYLSDSVPHGAYTDAIITTAKGEEVTRLKQGDVMPDIESRTDVTAVSLRVGGLPGGETFSIVSTYDPAGAPLPMCASAEPRLGTATSSPLPSEPVASPSANSPEPLLPGSSMAPGPEPLSGPESAVFACGALLPPAREGTLGLDVTWQTGSQPLGERNPNQFQFGDGGVLAQGELPDAGPPQGELESANWSDSSNASTSLAVFGTVVAAKDGVVVGVSSTWHAAAPADAVAFGDTGNGTELIGVFIADVDARMVPCPDFAEGDLEGADTVMLLGTGAIGGPYEFAWTPVDRP